MAVTKITGAGLGLPNADGNALGGASNEWSDLYLADGGTIQLGNDQDVTLTHVADTGILLNSTMAIQFNDSSQYINAPSATVLDINATDEVEVNATLMDINANVEISGTATTTGVHTFTAVPVFPNNTVETADIQADAITGAKIADDAIDSEHYTDGSIDNAHIADDAIDSEHYADGSIDSAHLADDAVTLAKMASGTDGNVISYDASGNPVAIATGSDGQVLTSTGAGSPPAFETISAGMTLGTEQASTSGTAITFTSIPAGTKMIVMGLDAVSTSSTGEIYVEIGDAGGIETSGYYSSGFRMVNSTNGVYGGGSTSRFDISDTTTAANYYSGSIILVLEDSASNCWTLNANIADSGSIMIVGAGRKLLSAELTQVKLSWSSGTFDAGAVNITYI